VNRETLTFSGDSFTVTARGICVDPPLPIVITDARGRTVTVTVSNVPGTAVTPPLLVAPTSVSLSSCNSSVSVTAAGGTGNYIANAGSDAIIVTPAGNTFSIRRRNPSPATSSPTQVTVSDGVSFVDVTVDLVGEAVGACPTLALSRSSVTLSNCSRQDVTISGGSPPYIAGSNNVMIDANVSGTTLFIQRAAGPDAGTPNPATVTVTDSIGITRTVRVDATGTGAGGGNGTCP
jgi:hypothetical protein